MQNLGHTSRGWRLVEPRLITGLLGLVCLVTTSGCFAPFCYSGIPACELPDSFRTPTRSTTPRMNLSNLALPTPKEYLLGMNDTLEVTIPDLLRRGEINPIQVQVTASGEIQLPLVATVKVGGMNLGQAQKAINDAYEGVLVNPRAVVRLFQKATIDVVVLGEVTTPGHYPLNKYENDVAHAIASATGMTQNADHVRGNSPSGNCSPHRPAKNSDAAATGSRRGRRHGPAQRQDARSSRLRSRSPPASSPEKTSWSLTRKSASRDGTIRRRKCVLSRWKGPHMNQYEAALNPSRTRTPAKTCSTPTATSPST